MVRSMHRRREVPETLLRLAALQSSMVTREQAFSLGMSRESLSRLVKSGQWLRISPGLFSTVPVQPSWEGLAWGGTLLGGPLARLGPEASAMSTVLFAGRPGPLTCWSRLLRQYAFRDHGGSFEKQMACDHAARPDRRRG